MIIPALDNQKHYWIGQDEIEKLLTKGEGWLESHPEKEWIVSRYLKRRMNLAREALQRLVPMSGDEEDGQPEDAKEPEVERKISLHTRRLDRVAELIESMSPASVVDLGCGEGKTACPTSEENEDSEDHRYGRGFSLPWPRAGFSGDEK